MKNSSYKKSATYIKSKTHEVRIMKTISTQRPPTRLKAVLGAITGAALCASLVPGMVYANTASNNIIRNTATVNYEDTGGNTQNPISSSADIVVNLVESTPLLNAPANQSTDAATAATYSYTITSTANGPDIYDLAATVTAESAGITGGTSTAVPSVATITLGATTVALAAVATDTVITVPSDGANDGSVNGITAADTVVIGVTAYTVASVDDSNGGNSGTSTITLTAGLAAGANVGDVIGERGSFTVDVTPGTVTDATVIQTIDVDVTAQDDAATAGADTHATVTTVTAVGLTVTKFVRNVTTGTAGGGTTVSYGGNTFYTTGVTAVPAQTLEYLVRVVSDNGSSGAAAVEITDPIPGFTTEVTGAYGGSDVEVFFSDFSGGPSTSTSQWTFSVNGDEANLTGGNLTVNVGNATGSADAAGNGGSLSADDFVYMLFRVTID